MSRIRSKDTKPELRLREELGAAGLRGYRLHWGEFKADVAWPGFKVAVFVDGRFWHGALNTPKTNTEFWQLKFDRNRARDRVANGALKRDGWIVVRYWDDEKPPIGRIKRAVNGRRSRFVQRILQGNRGYATGNPGERDRRRAGQA
jgi:DNA mismatch endonuclease (patch repair protein)